MDALGPVVFIILALAVGGVVLYLQWQLAEKRRQAWAAAAATLGFQFSAQDPFGLVSLPFVLFRSGDGQGTENVIWGRWNDLDLKVFDAWYYIRRHNTKGGSRREYHRFTCALVDLPVSCPHLSVSRETVLSRLADGLGMRDIEFESEEFNRAFQVQSDDRRFASYMVDARMMEWLLTTHPYLRFEVHGPRLLCYVRRVAPDQTGELLETSAGFVAAVPRVVHDVYGEAR